MKPYQKSSLLKRIEMLEFWNPGNESLLIDISDAEYLIRLIKADLATTKSENELILTDLPYGSIPGLD